MLLDDLQQELDQLEMEGLTRTCRSVEPLPGGRIRVDGTEKIHLASNSYLGLHQHPRVIAAAEEALRHYGTGSGSARLIGGTFPLHEALEEKLAELKQTEAALLFPTGYMANSGIITALVGPGDLVIGDHFNHASLVDGCRLSRAAFRVYPHKNMERLDTALKLRRKKYRRALIVTEGLFSMDGDIAPLPEIVGIAQAHEADLLIDDAHATGVLGPNGRGTLDHFGIPPQGILQMGTLSKALGSLGGFFAGPKTAVAYLRNKARSFIYTTASPAAVAAAGLEAIHVMRQEPIWRTTLKENIGLWIHGLRASGYSLISAESPIVPLLIGESRPTMELANSLFEQGVYAPGIRPPTVPEGMARIRTSLTSLHSKIDLERALRIFHHLFEKKMVRDLA